MAEFHARLGEGLFLIYLIVLGIVWFMGRRGRDVPSWLIGLSHGILGLQVAIGAILFLEEPDRIVWYHPLIGILAMLALGLTPVFRQRFGRVNGAVATLGVVAALALLAMITATTG
jgi:energy-converting hydrogenase Eha subunit A